MQKHFDSRDRERRFDGDTDWGQPRSRHGHGKLRRVRHKPYKRQPTGDRRSWFDQTDDSD